jgi:hypothetical protein
MNLKDISVKQFIELKTIIDAKNYADEIDREVDLLSTLTGKEKEFFLNLNLYDWRKYRNELSVLNLDKIEPKAERFIKANGKIYAPIYEFDELTAGQLVDITHFLKNPENLIQNLPQILASFCVPTKRTLFGRKKLSYLSVPHSKVAEDMKAASIFDAYSIAVFFCHVLNSFLENTAGYLTKTAIQAKTAKGETLTTEETKALFLILERFGVGTIPRSK